jgi:predicted RNase H-like nuclease (RuvC/YqgF family)
MNKKHAEVEKNQENLNNANQIIRQQQDEIKSNQSNIKATVDTLRKQLEKSNQENQKLRKKIESLEQKPKQQSNQAAPGTDTIIALINAIVIPLIQKASTNQFQQFQSQSPQINCLELELKKILQENELYDGKNSDSKWLRTLR